MEAKAVGGLDVCFFIGGDDHQRPVRVDYVRLAGSGGSFRSMMHGNAGPFQMCPDEVR
jgi:hypothetical protein